MVTGAPGLNGINWDLRYDAPTLVALRTTPPENPHIWEEPRFQDTRHPPDHALGHHAADRHPDGGARQVPGALHGRRHSATRSRSR